MTRTIEIIEQYLSEIWKPFDAKDESTWPEIGSKWVVRNKHEIIMCKFDTSWGGGLWFDPTEDRIFSVTHYLDPADILPKEDK